MLLSGAVWEGDVCVQSAPWDCAVSDEAESRPSSCDRFSVLLASRADTSGEVPVAKTRLRGQDVRLFLVSKQIVWAFIPPVARGESRFCKALLLPSSAPLPPTAPACLRRVFSR